MTPRSLSAGKRPASGLGPGRKPGDGSRLRTGQSRSTRFFCRYTERFPLVVSRKGPGTNSEAVAEAAQPGNPLLEFSAPSLIAAYQAGDHAAISKRLLGVLDHLRDPTYQSLDARTVHALNAFAKHFLYFFTQEDYSPADADPAAFVARNAVIANLAAMTEFGTTDAFVQILLGQSRNFTKLLAIYSSRNRIHIDPRLLFNTNPFLRIARSMALPRPLPDC